MHVAMTAI